MIPQEPNPQPAPPPGLIPGRLARILLVDDDLINQKVMINLLKRKGWDALPAGSGRKCLELLDQQTFDLVLMDIQMPEMDGYQTAALIRQRESQRNAGASSPQNTDPHAVTSPPRVPIVALTTMSQPGTRERCLEAGMDDHLTKPVNTQELYTTIQRLLRLPA